MKHLLLLLLGLLFLFACTDDSLIPHASDQDVLENFDEDFTKKGKGKRIIFDSGRDGNSQIYVMNADGSGQTRLTDNTHNDSNPAWSPNRQKIVFVSDRDGSDEIYVMNADGTEQTNISNNTANDSEPAWSPNGQQVVFVSDRDGNDEVYVMNTDGTDQTRLTDNDANDGDPSWSTNGNLITFESNRDAGGGPFATQLFDVFQMNADGTGQTNITNNPDFLDGVPQLSTNGKKIVFHSVRVQELPPNFEIYVMNADGTEQTQLTDNPGFDVTPSWSKNGKQIAFVRNSQIYVMNADGTEQTNISNHSYSDGNPDW